MTGSRGKGRPRGTSGGMRRILLTLVLAPLVFACSGKGEDDQPKVFDYSMPYGADTDPKALLNNLVGRWYPLEEVKRLSDDSMTAKQWCSRDPLMVKISLDEVLVRCAADQVFEFAIGRVARHKESSGAEIFLRAPESSALRSLAFERHVGPEATVSGIPCYDKKAHEYRRFPSFESLRRAVLDGKRCSQLRDNAAAAGAL